MALVCACVLHFVPDEEKPHQVMAQYRDQLASSSYLVISHGTAGTPEDDPEDLAGSVTSVFRQASAQLHVRSPPEIRRFFDGFDLLDPGVTWINDWRPDPDVPPAGRPRSLRGGVGRTR